MTTGILYAGGAIASITYTPPTDTKVRISGTLTTSVATPTQLCTLNGINALASDCYATQGGQRATVQADYWLGAGITYTFATLGATHVIISVLES